MNLSMRRPIGPTNPASTLPTDGKEEPPMPQLPVPTEYGCTRRLQNTWRSRHQSAIKGLRATRWPRPQDAATHCYRSEEHTSELQSRPHLVCRLLLEKKKK